MPLEVFIRREDAERFIEEVRGDDPEIAEKLRIEERELEAGGDGLERQNEEGPPTQSADVLATGGIARHPDAHMGNTLRSAQHRSVLRKYRAARRLQVRTAFEVVRVD